MSIIKEFNNSADRRLRILVAPLDWGLGHATRCIPIIKQLLEKDCEVIIASEGPQMLLLEREFPNLRFVQLKGYRLKYGRSKWETWLKIIFQIPKILIRINQEKRWLDRFLLQEPLDAVIADNRYGLYSASLFSVFITHQLYIKTYFPAFMEQVLQKINYRMIERFALCWVPDFESSDSLAGQLAHPNQLPDIPTRYLGPLTRLTKLENLPQTERQLLVLLSGPEPQRSILEKIVLEELKTYSGKAILIRGMPGELNCPSPVNGPRVYTHLAAKELNEILCQSTYIISRSGYSSIMDLAILGKKTILIPTPGQPEQEYLAAYLFNKKVFFMTPQQGFSLDACLESAEQFPYLSIADPGSFLLGRHIRGLLESIQSGVVYSAFG